MRSLLICLPIALTLTSCATDRPTRTLIGAGAGGAIGAAAAGINGAALGVVAGGALGALVPSTVVQGRQYYRDSRGYCYYIDKKGKPRYTKKVHC